MSQSLSSLDWRHGLCILSICIHSGLFTATSADNDNTTDLIELGPPRLAHQRVDPCLAGPRHHPNSAISPQRIATASTAAQQRRTNHVLPRHPPGRHQPGDQAAEASSMLRARYVRIYSENLGLIGCVQTTAQQARRGKTSGCAADGYVSALERRRLLHFLSRDRILTIS